MSLEDKLSEKESQIAELKKQLILIQKQSEQAKIGLKIAQNEKNLHN